MIGIKQKKRNILIIAGAALVLNFLLIYSLMVSKPSAPSIPSPPSLPPATSSPTPRPRLATFSLSPAETTASPNEPLTLTLTLATEFALTGADAVLRFDPELLTVQEIEAGGLFSLYPRLTYDNNSGQIIITGINIDLPDSPNSPNLPNSSPFATLILLPKQPGETQVEFEFKYSQTTGSTVVRAEDAKNILSHVENATITIE